ncbi:MAG TPA: hypothetical protein VFR02_09750 [bacterium]|nr:hypothetical protein [bacterium]
MPSDELFPEVSKPPAGWDGLEKRINRLLESVVQLRNSNGQLMKENMGLKNQLREAASSPAVDSAETEKLRRDYTRALEDLRKLQKNLAQMEKLTAELRGKKAGEAEAS